MSRAGLRVVVDPSLWQFLHRGRRPDDGNGARVVHVADDERPSVGHVVQSVGVPLTEIGALLLDGEPADPDERAPSSGTLEVTPRERPQRTPTTPPRFVLDVHLGALARRMRLLGLDVAYDNDAGDDELLATSLTQYRVLLTRDRGLLMRRHQRWAAFVRGQRSDDQLADVLERFVPPLRPWTRCLLCNGLLERVAVEQVAHQLQPGTLRTYSHFARCTSCGRPFWQGAHARRLRAVVGAAEERVSARPPPRPRGAAP